jgi:NAD(P)H-hydrate epimerase
MQPLNRHWSREVDRRAINDWHMLGLVLMENAGRGAAEWIVANTKPDDHIAILCGKGNNAGDGFVIARHLDAISRRVSMILLADPNSLKGDALANWRIVERSRISRIVVDPSGPIRETIEGSLRSATVVVDAMLGTGATGDPRSPMSDAIEIANALPATRIAIDLPTGLDCDTGVASKTTFLADDTLTFVASKIGFDAPMAREFTGQVHVFPIGVPGELLEEIERESAPNL